MHCLKERFSIADPKLDYGALIDLWTEGIAPQDSGAAVSCTESSQVIGEGYL
jgi:hypothetical protein